MTLSTPGIFSASEVSGYDAVILYLEDDMTLTDDDGNILLGVGDELQYLVLSLAGYDELCLDIGVDILLTDSHTEAVYRDYAEQTILYLEQRTGVDRLSHIVGGCEYRLTDHIFEDL